MLVGLPVLIFMKHLNWRNISVHFLRNLQCSLLYIKHLLLIRSLRIDSVSRREMIVIEGNTLTLLWKVTGCHRIKLKGIGMYPGNIAGIELHFFRELDPLEITFYGIKTALTHAFSINAHAVHVCSNMEAKISIAGTSGTRLKTIQIRNSIQGVNFGHISLQFPHSKGIKFIPMKISDTLNNDR